MRGGGGGGGARAHATRRPARPPARAQAAAAFEAKRAADGLVSVRRARERDFLAQPAARSWAGDGLLRDGAAVQVASLAGAASRVLACDVFRLSPGGLARVVTVPSSDVEGAGGGAQARP